MEIKHIIGSGLYSDRRINLRAMQTQECVECNRVFDMDIDIDANEWQYGHDCEEE